MFYSKLQCHKREKKKKERKALGAQKLGFESITHHWGLSSGAVVKTLPVNAEDARDVGLIPGSGRAARV